MRPETFYAQTAREIGRELGDRSRPVLARSAPAAIEDDDSGAGPIAERLPAFMAQLRDRQRPPDIIPDLVAGSRTILAPSHYKFSTAPDPFVIVLEADDPKRPTWVRLRGENTTAAAASEVALHERVLEYLRDHPGTSGSAVAKGIHVSKADTLNALDALRLGGLVDFYKRGPAQLWSVLSAESGS